MKGEEETEKGDKSGVNLERSTYNELVMQSKKNTFF